MTVRTSKGKTFDADFALELSGENSLLIQLRGDTRAVSRIAQDFEGLEWIETDSGRLTQYTDLRIVCRLDAQTVQARIFREV